MAKKLIVKEGDTVLDLGTGSGILAIFAADKADKVIAIDINPAAVQIARTNAELNGMKEKIEVREGDLFEPVEGEKFDFIIFNPPYLPGKPNNLLAQAWYDEEQQLISRFFKQVGEYLKDGGRIQISYSTLGYVSRLEQIIESSGFEFKVISKILTPFEKIYIYHINR